MTTAPTSSFFPPLDKCLSGEARLISWKTAYRVLSLSSDDAADSSTLEPFFSDPETQNFLTNALDPFLQPGSKTKSDFETKTAPIHVSASANGEFDVDELKKDALWLSKEIDVEELVALRCALLEWQQRPATQLLSAVTGGSEDAVSGALNAGTNTQGQASVTDSADETLRRSRQLQVYLEERTHILKLSTFMVNRFATQETTRSSDGNWLDAIAQKIAEGQCSPNNKTAHDSFLTSCIDNLDGSLRKLDDSSKMPKAYAADDDKQLIYAAATFTDITSALRLLLASVSTLCCPSHIPSSTVVLSWFKLIGKLAFFQDLPSSPALPDPTPIQALVSAISVAILRLTNVIPRVQNHLRPLLESSDGVRYPDLPTSNSEYYQNESCLREVNLILYRAATLNMNLSLAAPALFAWSMLTFTMRDAAKQIRDTREPRQTREEESSDGDGGRGLRRQSSRDDANPLERLFHQLQDVELENDARDDPPKFFAETAIDHMGGLGIMSQLCLSASTIWGSKAEAGTSFIVRSTLFDLLREGMQILDYDEPALSAILSVISPEADDQQPSLDRRLAIRFASDETFGRTILDQAFARYPFELSPLLRLLTCLARSTSKHHTGPTDLVNTLENMPAMTVTVSRQFRDFILENEDENENAIALTQDLPLFISKQANSFYGTDYQGQRALTMGSSESNSSSVVLNLPAGTQGVVVKETRPLILRLDHEHSALEYLGLVLSTILPNSELLITPVESPLECSTAADIVTLIVALLKASLEQYQGMEEARSVLGRLSAALPERQDIAGVIISAMETELLTHLDQTVRDGSLDLLVACADFLNILARISPERIWTMLNHSSLFGLASGANALAAVVGGIEVQMGRYRFLVSCAELYGRLIDDAVSGLVKRRVGVNKTTNRFDSPMSEQDVTPERTVKKVLIALQTSMTDAWMNLGDWRFAMKSERATLGASLLQTFDKLLRAAYGVGTEPDRGGITSLLVPAAEVLIGSTTTGDAMAVKGFAASFAVGVDLDDASSPGNDKTRSIHQVQAGADFLTTLLRTLRMLDSKDEEHSLNREAVLGRQLVNMMPVLAALTATDHAYKKCATALLAEVVQAIDVARGDDHTTPSLLGQFNLDAGKAFLKLIAQLDRPLREVEVEQEMWTFLATVMGSKQQWFAIYLLTGSLPKDRLLQGGKDNNKSVLKHALNQLASLADIEPQRAAAMLKFVACAQNAWVWATSQVREHTEFLKNSLEWLSRLKPPSRAGNMAEELMSAGEYRMAGFLCEIIATSVHCGREIGDSTVLKLLVPKMAFLRDHAGAVDAYNRSLHRNLAENFAKRFTAQACAANDFKRTACNPAAYGREFHYDLQLADRVLGHEMAWQGFGSRPREQGFKEEFARANVNLSLMHAQRDLLSAWRVLMSTLCECVGQQPATDGGNLNVQLALIAEKCLMANRDTNLEVPGMDEVVEIRAGLAFMIMSTLVNVKADCPEMKSLLPAAWSALSTAPVDYDVASAPEDMNYYRTLLQVLYLAIQPHVYLAATRRPANSTRSTSAADQTTRDFLDLTVGGYLVEVVAKVVAPGFRALCGNLHTSIDMAQPADFALLTAILRAVLSVRGIEAFFPQIVEIVAASGLVRGALSLYSWASILAETMATGGEQDPIYGEVAILFVVALSAIPAVAEQMALDGVLNQLASANLSNYFRKPGGKGPFDEPKRVFTIWTEGFLPLTLNILDAVGTQVAADISAFLDTFQPQLKRAESALENRAPSTRNPYAGRVTLGMASEAHNLCLIAKLLSVAVANAADAGVNANDVPPLDFDWVKVRDDAMGLVRQQASLASRIVPVSEREEVWFRQASSGSENLLLAKVAREIQELGEWLGDGGGD